MAKPDDDALAKTLARSVPGGADEEPSDDGLLPRGTSLGRYLLLQWLGEGGMGRIYVAYDPELGRQLAIKLLRPRGAGTQGTEQDRARLLREARAMGQLSHPNVVAVYDVGTHQDRVFIAMELVEGGTLRDWMYQQPHPWREVLEKVMDAGRGLAAAHAAGLIHRDFKPNNVLLGKDGRVKVMDFGLAHSAQSTEVPMLPEKGSGTASPPLQAVTVFGSVSGTPAYMAPEQMKGATVDARTDQFAFFASLYEGLYGELPFAPATTPAGFEEQVERVEKGELRDGARRSGAPARVRAIILRGLSADPAKRFPSMDSGLDALTRATRPWLPRVLPAVLPLAALVGVLGYVFVSKAVPGPCSGTAARIAGAWSPAVKEQAKKAFLATGDDFASEAWTGTEHILEAYARDWGTQDAAACEAGVRDPAAELPKRQAECLSDALAEFQALTALLSRADKGLVVASTMAAATLAPLRNCVDPRALKRAASGASAGSPIETQGLRQRLSGVRALVDAGKFREAAEPASTLVAAARAAKSPPLLAETLALEARIQSLATHNKEALSEYDEADLVAEACGMDWLQAQIAGGMVHLEYVLEDRAAGARWARRAQARIDRVGGDPLLQAGLWAAEGALAREANDVTAAERFKSAISLLEQTVGPDHPTTVNQMRNLASTYEQFGLFDLGLPLAERTVPLSEKAFGPHHPNTTLAVKTLANLLGDVGDFARARELAERALVALRSQYGADSFRTGEAELTLGELMVGLGEYEQALGHVRTAHDIFARDLGDASMQSSTAVMIEADVERNLGHRAEARRGGMRSLEMIEKAGGAGDDLVDPDLLLGRIELDDGRLTDALKWTEAARKAGEKGCSGGNIGCTQIPQQLGLVLVALKRYPEAVEPLEGVLKARAGHRFPVRENAEAEFSLAQALWGANLDRQRAASLAREAEEALAGAPKSADPLRAELRAWRKSH